MKYSEIFYSIQGEEQLIGYPSVFSELVTVTCGVFGAILPTLVGNRKIKIFQWKMQSMLYWLITASK